MTLNTSPRQHVKTIIVGTGFAGLCMGMALKRRGDNDFLLIERADDVGGTWRDNTYPGAACDVPSHLYSFSHRLNPDWSRTFSPGPEIQEYLRSSAREAGLLPHTVFNADMTSAQWDSAEQRWHVATTAGAYTAQFVITGTGHLADESYPSVPGLESFTGELFHSARWNHDVSLEGKRIGIVGTGASAIQIVPELAKIASELVVFQRTAPYIIPRQEREYTDGEKRLFRRNPDTMRQLRSQLFWEGENSYAQRRAIPQFLEAGKNMALRHLADQVEDADLRAKLTPDYEPGCKRVLISNTYYPALQAPVTTLEASALQHVEGSTAIAASGETYDLDVLVFATGFEATEPPYAQLVYGKEGLNLSKHWEKGMQAYDSVTVAGFPNLFSINGPNTSLGHNSIVYIIESQVNYILGALDYVAANQAKSIEADPAAEEAYVEKIQQNAQGTVWINGGCKSWYVDERSGRLTLIWPDFGYAFRDENGEFSPDGYTLDQSVAAPVTTSV
ncbi:flavin-containing monooxygenase [Enteractinococcus helveticum]|uniref:4-hydroxyacetophenone monooxygenase n=1 Tax=Enteractinococcus helveticum TaxID=1837282 RepID=A0A1B7M0H7_9MICC|nr:NAD(P)/FAD-dependent oxidoreductase [Enteractinococcus helveticum]OAV61569.1 4-hydroxyacetophenone monooxygenase [Enteractinococcus helveticum]